MSDFVPFKKIPRLKRGCVITEKIDGTNAQIVIDSEGNVRAGYRNKWITPADDNAGFARWVHDNQDELRNGLGEGQHFGEWWGGKIQRGYDRKEKTFSLFNTSRWLGKQPQCCDVVPLLYTGDFDTRIVDEVLNELSTGGSVAAPGYMKPEGVIVYLPVANSYFKVLIENDHLAKGQMA